MNKKIRGGERVENEKSPTSKAELLKKCNETLELLDETMKMSDLTLGKINNIYKDSHKTDKEIIDFQEEIIKMLEMTIKSQKTSIYISTFIISSFKDFVMTSIL